MRAWSYLLLRSSFFLALVLSLPAWVSGQAKPSGNLFVCQVQGKGFSSPFLGKTVRVAGVVTADLDNTSRRGFFLQQAGCDGDPATSDGLFVTLGQSIDRVSIGDRVEVTGLVEERSGQTELRTTPDSVLLLQTGESLPAPVEITPPFSPTAARWYLESLEGMVVSLQAGIVVGPTDADGRSWFVDAGLGIQRVFHGEEGGEGAVLCVDDRGTYEIAPAVSVGERVEGLQGVLEHRQDVYCLQLFSPPGPVLHRLESLHLLSHITGRSSLTSPGQASTPATTHTFTTGTFNLSNLYDALDDPETQDEVLTAAEYRRRLEKRALTIHEVLREPELIGVQEVENESVLKALLAHPEIQTPYHYLWKDGPDPRGLDVALLYQPDRLILVDSWTLQSCTSLVDGLGPDGNGNVFNPVNHLTCDQNNDGVLDGNRLFSRPPLVAHFRLCPTGCNSDGARADVWVIANHWKSRLEDGYSIPYTAARRDEEALEVAHLSQSLLASQPTATLILLGDLNDEPGSQPLSRLLQLGLSNPWTWMAAIQRYSYIFHGISQSPDYFLFRPSLPLWPIGFNAAHINADYPTLFSKVPATVFRSSDHDPLTLSFIYFTHQTYLPTISTR